MEYLAQKAEKERVVVAIDEFPSLLKEERDSLHPSGLLGDRSLKN